MFLFFLLFFLFGVSFSSNASFLSDDEVYEALKYSVGRCITIKNAGLPNEEEGHCTCALVAPDAVITAQHCLNENFENPSAEKTPTRIRLRLQGRLYGTVAIIARGERNSRRGGDWITLRLATPVPGGKPLPLSTTAPSTNDQIAIVGYGMPTRSSDPGIATVRPDCKIRKYGSAVIEQSCRVNPGDSGSPLVAYNPTDGWRIIGINYSYELQKTEIGGGGAPMQLVTGVKHYAATAKPAMLTGISSPQ